MRYIFKIKKVYFFSYYFTNVVTHFCCFDQLCTNNTYRRDVLQSHNFFKFSHIFCGRNIHKVDGDFQQKNPIITRYKSAEDANGQSKRKRNKYKFSIIKELVHVFFKQFTVGS